MTYIVSGWALNFTHSLTTDNNEKLTCLRHHQKIEVLISVCNKQS